MEVEVEDAEEIDAGVVARACEWLAAWLRNEEPPLWRGPAEVILRARTIVVELGPRKPIRQSAPERRRFRLRLAPGQHPPAALDTEPDDDCASVLAVLYVPPSLRDHEEHET